MSKNYLQDVFIELPVSENQMQLFSGEDIVESFPDVFPEETADFLRHGVNTNTKNPDIQTFINNMNRMMAEISSISGESIHTINRSWILDCMINALVPAVFPKYGFTTTIDIDSLEETETK